MLDTEADQPAEIYQTASTDSAEGSEVVQSGTLRECIDAYADLPSAGRDGLAIRFTSTKDERIQLHRYDIETLKPM